MHDSDDWDDLTLTAYIDGELDAAAQAAVLSEMEHDTDLRDRVCRLRRTKDWVRAGFGSAMPPSKRQLSTRGAPWLRLRSGLAAAVLALAFGLGGGLLGYACAEYGDGHLARQTDPNKIVLHIDDANPAHFKHLLDYTEAFLRKHRKDGAQVEVVANAGGLNLLRADVSPYARRVQRLSETYSNVRFIACMNAIRNLRKAGVNPVLIDTVQSGETAIDHIVKRLRQGWTYQKIADLNDI